MPRTKERIRLKGSDTGYILRHDKWKIVHHSGRNWYSLQIMTPDGWAEVLFTDTPGKIRAELELLTGNAEAVTKKFVSHEDLEDK